jgi:hypothetical protein
LEKLPQQSWAGTSTSFVIGKPKPTTRGIKKFGAVPPIGSTGTTGKGIRFFPPIGSTGTTGKESDKPEE